MNLSIREAGEADAVLIAELSQQTFYDTFAPYNSQADMDKFLREQFTKGRLMLEVGARENRFYLAYQDDRVAGYLKLRDARAPEKLGTSHTLEIARLYSCRDMIGKGIGQLLMEKSLEEARRLKKESVWLGVWEKNERAIAFYRKYGFEIFDETAFLLGDDVQRDWLMVRRMSDE
jgi:ribosomal protein S18 acetylase RimI-like enzyme